MIRSTSISLPAPESWEEFEVLVAELFEHEREVEIHRHGRSGQSDYGVDLYYENEQGEFVGIQCKLTNEITGKTIRQEIEEAESFEPSLSEYIIVTSAPQDSAVQKEVRQIASNRESQDHFETNLYMWDDVGRLLARNEEVFEQFYGEYIETPALELADHGIIQITEKQFTPESARNPETAWQSELTFSEIAAGYAFERFTEDDVSLSKKTSRLLQSDRSVALCGGAAEGKTVCAKQTTHRLYEKGKDVLYCPDSSDVGSAQQEIIEWATDVESGVIVIDGGEDCLEAVFNLVEVAESTKNFRVLFTIRQSVWQRFAEDEIEGQEAVRPTSIESLRIPDLSIIEIRAALERYQQITDTVLNVAPKSLYSRISRDDSQSSLLVLLHLIAVHKGQSRGIHDARERTILHENALSTANTLETELERLLAFTTCILRTSHLPASPEFYHSFIREGYSHQEISEAIDSLQGQFIFGLRSGQYQTKHEVWCSIFLEVQLNTEGDKGAIARFEKCVNAIFQLAEDHELRRSINNWFRREVIPEALNEEFIAAMLTQRLFLPGQRYNQLIDYYGDSEYSGIELPKSTPVGAYLHQYIWRGAMALSRGGSSGGMSDLAWAEKEYSALLDHAEDIDDAPTEALLDIESLALTNIAQVKQRRGEIDEAIEDLERAQEIAVELDDKHSESVVLGNIAANHVYAGDAYAAESKYKEAIQIRREIGDYLGWAKALGGLSVIYFERGESDRAEACNNTAKRVFEELGDLHNLSLVYSRTANSLYARGDKEAAKGLQRQSLRINEQLDDQEKIARDLMGLGSWELKEQNPEKAEKYTRKAREILVEAGADREIAKCDANLANIETLRGNYQKAIKEQERVIDVFQEFGDRGSEGRGWADLGTIYLHKREFSTAIDCLTKAYELLMEAGEDRTAFSVMLNIGQIADHGGSQQMGGHFYKTAMLDFFKSDSYYLGLEALDSYLQIHIDRSNPKQSISLALQGWLIAHREGIDEWKTHYLILYHFLFGMGHPDLYSLVKSELYEILSSFEIDGPVYIEYAHDLVDGLDLKEKQDSE